MADMRQYAERLAQALPHLYEMDVWVTGWRLIHRTAQVLRSDHSIAQQWAFWGPLAAEMKIEAISVGTFDGDCHFVGPTNLLEAIAEAVCQEAERRVGPTP